MNEKGYKAFGKGLVCKGKQYAENTTYEEQGGEICCAGMMHYCVNPLDVLDYYPLIDDNGDLTEFAEVTAEEEPVTDDGKKFATKKLHIGAKLSFSKFVHACVDFLYEKTTKEANTPASGGGSKLAASGDGSQLAASGDGSQLAASGYGSQLAASGDGPQLAASGGGSKLAASGDGSQLAASGDGSQLAASGNYSQLAASGYGSKLAASGNYSQLAASGNYSQLAASGNYSQLAASGDGSQLAASGNYSQLAASGDRSQLDLKGEESVGAAIGYNSTIRGKIGSWITLAEYGDFNGRYRPCLCVKSAKIDGVTLKEDTWYTLKNGEFTEV